MLPPVDDPHFLGRLNLALTLTIQGKAQQVAAGDIKAFSLELDMEGFRATAGFWVLRNDLSQNTDPIDAFASHASIEVTATLDRYVDEPGKTMEPLTLIGVVVERRVLEWAVPGVGDSPVMRRYYEIAFVDPAAGLWSQHFPAVIAVETTLKQRIEAQLPPSISISSSWRGYEATLPMCAYALGPASFYDWLRWWLDLHDAFLRYDVVENAYTILDQKPSAAAQSFPQQGCGPLRWELPEPPRATLRILNGCTEVGTPIQTGTNDDALASLTRDVLIRTPVANAAAERLTLEGARTRGRDAELHGSFTEFPATRLSPGTVLSFEAPWSQETRFRASQWRLLRTKLTATAQDQDPSSDSGAAFNVYDVTYRFALERADDPVWRRRPYVAPAYPFVVEGKIVSEQGEAEEGTYQAYQDQTTMCWVYKVHVPLFDVTVSAPYDAQAMPGHFYFPAYKDERVLLHVHATEATLAGFLDWRPGARLPQDSQGNHLLLGKRGTDETSMNHVYEDGNPAFRIERTHGRDRQIVTIEEGLVRIETREDDSARA